MATIRKEDATMSSEEMLARSSSWTLACDNALLNRLKSFSENLSRNSQDITKECDNLSKDISHLDYNLRNVTNQFLMLSNTQFVENRVEEFKEFSADVPPTPITSVSLKSKAEKETELMSKMKQAIQLGLKACDRKTKRHEGDEEETPQQLFVKKRPFLIGSPKFFSSKYCGLVDETRRVVPVPWDLSSDADSIKSQTPISDILEPEVKPTVTFTMPPPSVPVFPVPENNLDEAGRQNHKIHPDNRHIGKGIIPPSPTISDRSSDLGKPSSSASVSRENVPRSVTDELNKIYGAFSPPPNAYDDSDDDFRPNASAGRIFDDEDDDLFGEKELFPSSQKNSDFFSRSNPSQLPAPPVFSAPPPVNQVPQPQSAFSNNSARTPLVGSSPKPNDVPNVSSTPDEASKKDATRNEAPQPEVEVGSVRSKLPPGAVSMFGGMPPPVFNNEKLQAAITTTKTEPASSLPSKQNANRVETETSSSKQEAVSSARKDSKSVSSHHHHHNKQETVNAKKVNTSQPGAVASAPQKTAENISRGSLSSAGDLQRTTNKVPASSLFADDSSDEDIFKSSKKKSNTNLFNAENDSIGIGSSQQPPSAPVSNPFSATPNAKKVITPAPAKPAPVLQKRQVKKSIFDDSESDDDLFASKSSSITKPSSSSTKKETPTVAKNLFKHETKKLTVPKQTKRSSLFGDDSDSDTDLFGNKKIVQGRKSEPNPAPKASTGPVPEAAKMEEELDNTEEDIFEESSHSTAVDTDANQVLNNNNIEDEPQSVKEKTSEVVKSSSSDAVSNKEEKPVKQKSGGSSRSRVKKSIFDDSDSDDDLFSSKSKVAVKIDKTLKVNCDISDNHTSKKHVSSSATNKKKLSLFGDESDSDTDIFTSKRKEVNKSSKGKKEEEKKEDLTDETSKTPVTKKESTPDENKRPSIPTPPIDDIFNDSDPVITKTSKGEKISNAGNHKDCLNNIVKNEPTKSTKPVGNKISEKIKAMQSGNSEGSKADDSSDATPKKPIKTKISVKNLALNLNINPLALKVGAKPPKLGGSSPSTPDKEVVDVPTSPANDDSSSTSATTASTTTTTEDTTTTEATTTKSTSVSPKDELGIEEMLYDRIKGKDETDDDSRSSDKPVASSSTPVKNDGADHFVEIIKARAKIQQKRRPPSKNFLRTLANHTEVETPETNHDETNDNDNTDNTEPEEETSESVDSISNST